MGQVLAMIKETMNESINIQIMNNHGAIDPKKEEKKNKFNSKKKKKWNGMAHIGELSQSSFFWFLFLFLKSSAHVYIFFSLLTLLCFDFFLMIEYIQPHGFVVNLKSFINSLTKGLL